MVDLVALALTLAGVVALYAGAEALVAGAGRLAIGFGLRAATVGVTVIAFATTSPELFVAIVGALEVSTDVGLGAIVGSNVANVGLVLGLTAVIRPLSVGERVMRRHVPFMVLAALLLYALGLDGQLGRFDGIVMLVTLVAFTGMLVYSVNTDSGPGVADPGAGEGIGVRDVGLVLAGLVGLIVGSQWLVSGGTALLSALGFSDLFVGLTVLALGTSLPELAASVVGALRGHAEFAVGNVVGSNIYNVLAVLGLVALIVPIPIATQTLRFELPVMIGFTLALVAVM
ncbi:MAG: calcium/sodium antiporter, partial [Halorubrum sp.]